MLVPSVLRLSDFTYVMIWQAFVWLPSLSTPSRIALSVGGRHGRPYVYPGGGHSPDSMIDNQGSLANPRRFTAVADSKAIGLSCYPVRVGWSTSLDAWSGRARRGMADLLLRPNVLLRNHEPPLGGVLGEAVRERRWSVEAHGSRPVGQSRPQIWVLAQLG